MYVKIKTFTQITLVMSSLLVYSSCIKPEKEQPPDKVLLDKSQLKATTTTNNDGCVQYIGIDNHRADSSIPTVLGETLLGQPYSVSNMQAAAFIVHGTDAGIGVTHQYVRFRPANEDQLIALSEVADLDLFDYPLDRDVDVEGDYYPQPGIPLGDIPWFYTVVPLGYSFPAGIPREILQNLHLTEDLNLETEALRRTGNDYSYDCGPALVSSESQAVAQNSGKPAQASKPLLAMDPCPSGIVESDGIQFPMAPCPPLPPVGVPNLNCVALMPGTRGNPGIWCGDVVQRPASWRLTASCVEVYDWGDPSTPPTVMQVACPSWVTGIPPGNVNPPPPATRVPSGRILVRDKQLGVDQGVPNAKVVARRWFKIDRIQTNNAGEFFLTKRFRNKVNIHVKMENSGVNLRGIKGYAFWQIWFPIKASIGKFRGNMNNITSVFVDDNQKQTNQHKLWVAATAMRAFADYNQAAAQLGIGQPPSGLTILLTNLTNNDGAGSTPMNRHRTNAGAMPQSYIDYFIAHPGVAALSQLYNYLYNSKLLAGVDMSITYHRENWSSSDCKELFYHEFTHAAHFTQVGQSWWNTLVYAEASETARFGTGSNNSPYGDGTMGSVSNIIGLAESWAYHMGHFMTDRSYGASSAALVFAAQSYFTNSPVFGLSSNLNALEDFDPGRLQYPFRWIPSGVYYDLMDARNEATPVLDNVTGYTNQQFYQALTGDVSSIPQFRNKLLLNSNNNQVNQVNTLFLGYGY